MLLFITLNQSVRITAVNVFTAVLCMYFYIYFLNLVLISFHCILTFLFWDIKLYNQNHKYCVFFHYFVYFLLYTCWHFFLSYSTTVALIEVLLFCGLLRLSLFHAEIPIVIKYLQISREGEKIA